MNEKIAPKLVGMDVTKQKEIDKLMARGLEVRGLQIWRMRGIDWLPKRGSIWAVSEETKENVTFMDPDGCQHTVLHSLVGLRIG